MNARKLIACCSVLVVLMVITSACAPAAMPAAPQVVTQEVVVTKEVEKVVALEVNASANLPNAVSPGSLRMIIKNGEMTLLVVNTDRALEQTTDIAVNSGGYVVSSKTWDSGDRKSATLTMGVPSDQFEAVQRQLRALAVRVLNDTSSGQDVSDEYVDLQARLTNLEATAARIRELLKDAKDVDEALQVNIKLSEVESEIEQIKGRTQYLKDRSAFSTIVVNLQPDVPAPAPAAWQPGKTIEAAADSAGGLLRNLVDAAIWLVVAYGPVLIPVVLVVWFVVQMQRKRAKAGRAPAAPIETKPTVAE